MFHKSRMSKWQNCLSDTNAHSLWHQDTLTLSLFILHSAITHTRKHAQQLIICGKELTGPWNVQNRSFLLSFIHYRTDESRRTKRYGERWAEKLLIQMYDIGVQNKAERATGAALGTSNAPNLNLRDNLNCRLKYSITQWYGTGYVKLLNLKAYKNQKTNHYSYFCQSIW